MKRVRVARIVTRLNVGGPAVQALLLTERLDPARYEPLLVAGTAGPYEGDMLALRGAGVRPVVVPELVREISPLNDVRALTRLVRILRRFRPQIVHTHMAKAGFVGRIAARIARVPIVIHTFHGHVFRGYFGSTRSRLFLIAERLLARLTTRIVAISPRQRGELLSLGVGQESTIVEVPLGFELAPFLDAPRGLLRRELGLADDTPLVGIVARLVAIKGVDVFLDAARLVADERPDAVFVVVGDGELRGELMARAERLGIEARTRFLRWRADIPAILSDLDVVALTSHSEGTPVSLIEALAAARAVVATRVGGVEDVIDEECGVLVEHGDVRGVAHAVLDLLADPTRRSLLGSRGRLRVFPRYDASTLLRNIDALYTDLMASL